jgi:hypothetical protein
MTLDATGGNGPFNGGKTIVATNAVSDLSGMTLSAPNSVLVYEGPTNINPHVAGALATPTIPGIVDGAEAFGLLPLSAMDLAGDLTSLFDDAPEGAIAALHRFDTGPSGFNYDWVGYDMLVYANLTGEQLLDPDLGAGLLGYSAPLLLGGYTRDTFFGGSGIVALAELDGFNVYATLIPELLTNEISFGGSGIHAATSSFANGETLYLAPVPEPSTVVLTALGMLGLMACAGRSPRCPAGNRANYGSATPASLR